MLWYLLNTQLSFENFCGPRQWLQSGFFLRNKNRAVHMRNLRLKDARSYLLGLQKKKKLFIPCTAFVSIAVFHILLTFTGTLPSTLLCNARLHPYSPDAETSRYPGGDNPKTVWIVSHRRSGTHMTIDLIAQAIEGPLRIVKAAHIVPMTDELSCECLTYLQQHGKFIHAYRDVRDVVVASYYYRKNFDREYAHLNFSSYLQNRNGLLVSVIRSWARSHVGWISQPNVLSLNFDETVLAYPHVLDKIASFLSQPVKSYTISPREMQSLSKAVSKFAGKGSCGWKVTIGPTTARKIVETAKDFLRREAVNKQKCAQQTTWNMTNMIKVGNTTDLFLPASCPTDFSLMPVVVTAALSNTNASRNGTIKYNQ